MPTATTKAYPVEYVHVDSVAKIPELIGVLLSINYNIDINVYREVIPGTPEIPPSAEDPDGTPAGPETYVDHYTFMISKNGVNPVRIALGDAVVWDKGVLYGFTVAEFLSRYDLPQG